MQANEYQSQASRALRDVPGFEIGLRNWVIIMNGIGLARAAGRVVEAIKKGIFHQHGLKDRDLLDLLCHVRKGSVNFFRRETSFPWWQMTNRETMVVWNLVGLLGEASEVADLILNALGEEEVDRQALSKELGDCLWYIAAIATKHNLDLDEIMEQNIAKLRARYPDGFTAEDSRRRVDVPEGDKV